MINATETLSEITEITGIDIEVLNVNQNDASIVTHDVIKAMNKHACKALDEALKRYNEARYRMFESGGKLILISDVIFKLKQELNLKN